jgi:hypothetical protein
VRRVLVTTVPDLGLLAALRDPAIDQIARAGGFGLLAGDRFDRRFLDPVPRYPDPVTGVPIRALLSEVAFERDTDVLVVVVGTQVDAPDWIVLAAGPPGRILSASGPPMGVTSATTRTAGVVADEDVLATIREYLGYRPPGLLGGGSPIRFEGEAPTDLYKRASDYLRVSDPLRVAVLVAAIAALGAGILLLFFPDLGPLKAAVAVAGLFAVAAMVALVPASVLPSLEPLVLLPVLAVIAGVLFAGALVAGRRDHAAAVAVVAVAGLLLLVIDGVLGWPAEVTPLLGGGALLGVRFFGLGNSGAGILMAGAVFGATWLRPWAGTAVLAGAALFAGLPMLGADLGGGVTLFAVAAIWSAWSLRGRLDRWSIGIAVAAAVVGAGLLVAAHVVWPSPTHVSRAVDAASGPGSLVRTALDRLGENVRTTTEVWPAWLAVLGLPVWLLVAWRRAGSFRPVLDRRPWWRGAVIVLALGGMIGYVVNDTYGMAVAAFAFVSAAMVYPALRERWSSG